MASDSTVMKKRRPFEENDALSDEQKELVPFQPTKKMRKRECGWSDLPSDLSMLIAERLAFPPHIDKFASICNDWLVASRDVSPPPLMLLPFDIRNSTSRFVDLSDHTNTYDLEMVDLEDGSICGSANGWLALTGGNFEMTLFNPWKRSQIALPTLPYRRNYWEPLVCKYYLTAPDFLRMSFVWKLVISGDPDHPESSEAANSCMVAVILGDGLRLAICRLGDEDWTFDPTKEEYPPDTYQGFRDVVFHKGKIYANTYKYLYEVEYRGPGDVQTKMIPIPYDGKCKTIGGRYIAISGEDIVLIERHQDMLRMGNARSPTMTDQFVVYKLERATKKWEVVHNLAGRTLFLGLSSSVSVSSKEYRYRWCKPDCIYYLDHYVNKFAKEHAGFQCDNGIFSVKENKFVHTFDIKHSLSFWPCPALWYL